MPEQDFSLSTNINVNPVLPLNTEYKRQIPDGWDEYRNSQHSFSLLYPEGLTIQEHFEAGDTTIVTFQNTTTQVGFQLYVTAYAAEEISEERFRQDIPSGVRKDLTNGQIDGVTAAFFYSEDDRLGETREIWFIKDGFLYEVNTVSVLGSWLDEIIKTWKFF